MAKIYIHFIGAWRLFLGVREIDIHANDIHEAKDYIERNYRPIFEKKLQSMGVKKGASVWENSNILINGKSVSEADPVIFKDGDAIDLIPLIAGG